MLLNRTKNFLAEEHGQDLIEYTLLIGVIFLASVAILLAGGGSMQGVWQHASSQLVAASTAS